MEMPSPEFLKAMTARDKEWGIDFDYLAAQPTGVLIEEITKLKNPEIVGPDRIKKHRAVALRAELEGREDFRRPWTQKESEVMQWLDEQISRSDDC